MTASYSIPSASSLEKAPHDRSISVKQALQKHKNKHNYNAVYTCIYIHHYTSMHMQNQMRSNAKRNRRRISKLLAHRDAAINVEDEVGSLPWRMLEMCPYPWCTSTFSTIITTNHHQPSPAVMVVPALAIATTTMATMVTNRMVITGGQGAS